MRNLQRFALLLVLLVASLQAACAQALDPTRTWAFVIGLYRFERPLLYDNFDVTDGRVDDMLVKVLRERGVPPTHIVHLRDGGARRKRILTSMGTLLASTRTGDTLFVYFGGHGDRDENGRCYLVPYDGAEDSSASCLPCASIVHAIDEGFRGDRVIMAIDACNSGGVVDVLRKTPTRIPFACMTACLANEESSDWDFTDCLLAGLRGDPCVDLDGDGRITLDELARFTAGELAYGQEQIASYYCNANVPHTLALSLSGGTRPAAPVGNHVEVKSEGKWWKARIVAADGARFRVHYYGLSERYDEWILAADVRPHTPLWFPQGTHVRVVSDDDGETARGVVVGAQGEVFLVHFDDGDEEWVEGRRLQMGDDHASLPGHLISRTSHL